MTRLIIFFVFLLPAATLAQTTLPDLQSPQWWIDAATKKLPGIYDTGTQQELVDSIVASGSFRSEKEWNVALDAVARTPDEKADFHLTEFCNLAGRYAEMGSLGAAREALERARDSPVARAHSCRMLLLTTRMRIDAAAGDFAAALKDIQSGDEDGRAAQVSWLEDQAVAAGAQDMAYHQLAARLAETKMPVSGLASEAIEFYLATVQSGQTVLARLQAGNDLPTESAVGYAMIAIEDARMGDARHGVDIARAVEIALAGEDDRDDMERMSIVSDLFAIGQDMEGTRRCADATGAVSKRMFQSMSHYYYTYLTRLQLAALEFDAAEHSETLSPNVLRPAIAKALLESGDIFGAMRVLSDYDDSKLAYEVGRRCAAAGKLEELRHWIELPQSSGVTINACCGAAVGISATTRPTK